MYRNTPATDLYLDEREPSYMGRMLQMCNRRLYRFWGDLTEAVRSGPATQSDVITVGPHPPRLGSGGKALLIRRAYDALPEGGAFIVQDTLVDDERRSNSLGLMMSLNMLVETPGGFDHKGADCCSWMRET
jgi:hypothetical protein